jgi:hypothetical protein
MVVVMDQRPALRFCAAEKFASAKRQNPNIIQTRALLMFPPDSFCRIEGESFQCTRTRDEQGREMIQRS